MEAKSDEVVHRSIPFVKIVEGKMKLLEHLQFAEDETIRIVSILGKARMGKSTFLNSIVSRIEGVTVAPFQTQDDDEHCTHGMDAYYCVKQKLLLLDCQGLALEDSSHDPALLLFAYLISDTIVFNERMMLQNEALKLMEPICTFMTYINVEEVQKPRLFFRISDADIVKSPQKNLEKVMVAYNDQYQSIRESIAHLFQPDIGIVKTNALDKDAKEILKTGDYYSLFSHPTIGFDTAIDELIESLPRGQFATLWKSKMPKIVENINRNEKISIDKLDLVGLNARIEIMEWTNKLPASLFSQIHVDGTQETFDRNVAPYKMKKAATLQEFTRIFASVTNTIKEPYYAKLEERLTVPFTEADTRSRKFAEDRLKSPLSEMLNHPFALITNATGSLTHLDPLFFESYLQPIRNVYAASMPLYEPVRKDCQAKLKAAEDSFMANVDAVRRAEAEEVRIMKVLCDTTVMNFTESVNETISTMTEFVAENKAFPILELEPLFIIQSLIRAKIVSVEQKLLEIPKLRFVKNGKNPNNEAEREIPLTTEYDLIKPIYTKFMEAMGAFRDPAVFVPSIMRRKEDILYGAMMPQSTNIPGVEFVEIVSDAVLSPTPFKMTKRTFLEIYKPAIIATITKLREKQYITEEDATILQLSENSPAIVGKHSIPYISALFCATYRKQIAKNRVTGKRGLVLKS